MYWAYDFCFTMSLHLVQSWKGRQNRQKERTEKERDGEIRIVVTQIFSFGLCF